MYLEVRDVSRWTGFVDRNFRSAIDFVRDVSASRILGNLVSKDCCLMFCPILIQIQRQL